MVGALLLEILHYRYANLAMATSSFGSQQSGGSEYYTSVSILKARPHPDEWTKAKELHMENRAPCEVRRSPALASKLVELFASSLSCLILLGCIQIPDMEVRGQQTTVHHERTDGRLFQMMALSQLKKKNIRAWWNCWEFGTRLDIRCVK